MDNKSKPEYYSALKINEAKTSKQMNLGCIILIEDTPSQKKEITYSISSSESSI